MHGQSPSYDYLLVIKIKHVQLMEDIRIASDFESTTVGHASTIFQNSTYDIIPSKILSPAKMIPMTRELYYTHTITQWTTQLQP